VPCDVYNWTPSRKEQRHLAKVIHYKGQRKDWMLRDYGSN